MSGNNNNDWDKILNGGSSHYNFSYRKERDKSIPNSTVTPAPVAMPVVPTSNTNVRPKNKKTQKIILPALKETMGGLKGGGHKRRHTRRVHRRRRHTRKQ
jgi:hypothetical protein